MTYRGQSVAADTRLRVKAASGQLQARDRCTFALSEPPVGELPSHPPSVERFRCQS